MRRRKHVGSYQPGLAPGTISEQPRTASRPITISVTDYSATDLTVRSGCTLADIDAAPDGGKRWIRVAGTPTTALVRRIGTAFGAHSLILEDILSSFHRIKVEDYDNLMFTVLHALHTTEDGVEHDDTLSVVLTPTTLLTVFEGDDSRFFDPIFARLENPESLVRHNGVDFLFHAILDLVVDCFFPIIEKLEDEAANVEAALLDRPGEQHLTEIHQLRSDTQVARSILWSTRDVISRIERSTHKFVQHETLFYFRDIHDHVVHLLDAISTLRDTATALMDLYMSGVSNRMNEVMKVLTIISTLFIPGTFIVGVYGMNFVHMPELKFPWAYPAVLGLIGMTAIALLIFFKRRKWF